jgi:DNA repair protein RadC
MEYQININYQFSAENENEAKDKASQYVSSNLTVKPIPEGVYNPAQVAEKCKSFRKAKKEHFCVFFLDTQNRILGKETVSIGTLNISLIHPRECFRTAILKTAASVIFVHNHPSGGLEPSAEDLNVTKRLKDAGKLLGIEVLDHVIVTAESYVSLRDENLI